MRFQLDVLLTEEDYIAFNYFHSAESPRGKKQVRIFLAFFVALMLIPIVYANIRLPGTIFAAAFTVLCGAAMVIYILLFKKRVMQNVKGQIKKLKKSGRLPFDPVSKIEFYDDKIVESTPLTRTEQSYDAMERVCILTDRYVLLYTSSVGAYILPMAQIRAQTDMNAFLQFLFQKCSRIEYY